MDSVRPNPNRALVWPSLALSLVVLITFLIKPLMFVHVFSAPLKLSGLTKLLYKAELSTLETFSRFEVINDSEFFLLRVQQIQGSVISDYYKRNRDFRSLSDLLEPSMPLLYAARKASDPEAGKMSLFMAALSSCLNNQASMQSYLETARTRGITIDDPTQLTKECQ